jgi:hypothetical protein
MGVPNYYENYIYNQEVNKLGPNDYVKVPGYNMDSNRGHIQMKDYLGALDAYERNNPDYLEALAAQKMEAKMNAFNDKRSSSWGDYLTYLPFTPQFENYQPNAYGKASNLMGRSWDNATQVVAPDGSLVGNPDYENYVYGRGPLADPAKMMAVQQDRQIFDSPREAATWYTTPRSKPIPNEYSVNYVEPDYVPFDENFNEGTDYRESSFWYSK